MTCSRLLRYLARLQYQAAVTASGQQGKCHQAADDVKRIVTYTGILQRDALRLLQSCTRKPSDRKCFVQELRED